MDPCQTVQHSADHASGGGSVHPVQGSARRLEIWHRVSSQGAPADTLHPAGQSSGNGAAGGRNHWRLAAASLFGLSPDS